MAGDGVNSGGSKETMAADATAATTPAAAAASIPPGAAVAGANSGSVTIATSSSGNSRNNKYLCAAPRPAEWEERAVAVLRGLGDKAWDVVQSTLESIRAKHGVVGEEGKKRGPGRKSNAEHALGFYEYLAEILQEQREQEEAETEESGDDEDEDDDDDDDDDDDGDDDDDDSCSDDGGGQNQSKKKSSGPNSDQSDDDGEEEDSGSDEAEQGDDSDTDNEGDEDGEEEEQSEGESVEGEEASDDEDEEEEDQDESEAEDASEEEEAEEINVASATKKKAPPAAAAAKEKDAAADADEQEDNTTAASMNTEEFNQQHNDLCEVCEEAGELLMCSTCNLVFHLECVRPAMETYPDKDEVWRCAYCVLASEPKFTKNRRISAAAVRLMARLRNAKRRQRQAEAKEKKKLQKDVIAADMDDDEENDDDASEQHQPNDDDPVKGSPATASAAKDAPAATAGAPDETNPDKMDDSKTATAQGAEKSDSENGNGDDDRKPAATKEVSKSEPSAVVVVKRKRGRPPVRTADEKKKLKKRPSRNSPTKVVEEKKLKKRPAVLKASPTAASSVKRGPGRPRKPEGEVKRKRGRPPKNRTDDEDDSPRAKKKIKIKKRGPGRPRKEPIVDEDDDEEEVAVVVKKGPGRPKKSPTAEESMASSKKKSSKKHSVGKDDGSALKGKAKKRPPKSPKPEELLTTKKRPSKQSPTRSHIDQEEEEVPVKRGPGRPPKKNPKKKSSKASKREKSLKKRGRGRPPRQQLKDDEDSDDTSDIRSKEELPANDGRNPKSPDDDSTDGDKKPASNSNADDSQPVNEETDGKSANNATAANKEKSPAEVANTLKHAETIGNVNDTDKKQSSMGEVAVSSTSEVRVKRGRGRPRRVQPTEDDNNKTADVKSNATPNAEQSNDSKPANDGSTEGDISLSPNQAAAESTGKQNDGDTSRAADGKQDDPAQKAESGKVDADAEGGKEGESREKTDDEASSLSPSKKRSLALNKLTDGFTGQLLVDSSEISVRGKRSRRQPTLYNPQLVPARRWQSDEVHRPEDDDKEQKNEPVDTANSKAKGESNDGKASRGSRRTVLCHFCHDDPSIELCCFCGCRKCFGKHNQSKLLLCDQCDSEYHMFCLDPPLTKVPSGKWLCPSCVETKELKPRASSATSKRDSTTPTSKSPPTASKKTPTASKKTLTERKGATKASSTGMVKKRGRGRPPKDKSKSEPPRKRIRKSSPSRRRRRGRPRKTVDEAEAKKRTGPPPARSADGRFISKPTPRAGRGRPKTASSGRSSGDSADDTSKAAASSGRSEEKEIDVKVSRSGRTVKRSSFHDELFEGEQHLKSSRPYSETRKDGGGQPQRRASIGSLPKKSPPTSSRESKRSPSRSDKRRTAGKKLSDGNDQDTDSDEAEEDDMVYEPTVGFSETNSRVPAPIVPGMSATLHDTADEPMATIPGASVQDSKPSRAAAATAAATLSTNTVGTFRSAITDSGTKMPPPPVPTVETRAAAAHGSAFAAAAARNSSRTPRRKPGARECMQISRRFGVRVIPDAYVEIMTDYCNRGKVEHLIRMRERLDEHSRFLEAQLAGLEALAKEKGESSVVVPPMPEGPDRKLERTIAGDDH